MKNFVKNSAKLLILLFFASSALAERAPRIKMPDSVVTNATMSFHLFDSYEEMNEYAEQLPNWELIDPGPKHMLHGFSICDRREDANIAYCDIYLVMPRRIDDEHTMTLGHEVLHGILGIYH